jgi:hypothetical protein
MQSTCAGKTPALQVRIRDRYVLCPSGKCLPTSQSQLPSPSSRGSKTRLMMRHPFVFCCIVGCARLCIIYLLSLRGVSQLSAESSWCRQKQMRLHHHATAAIDGSCMATKNSYRTKPPALIFLFRSNQAFNNKPCHVRLEVADSTYSHLLPNSSSSNFICIF